MAYITTTQLQTRLGATVYARLTDRVNGKTASTTTAQAIVDAAEAEADSYFAARYVTPLNLAASAALTAIVPTRVLDLAEHRAWAESPFASDIPARAQDAYYNAARWLTDVAHGRVKLPDAEESSVLDSDADPPLYASDERRLTADELDGL